MERVKQELEKTMEQVERPSRALRLWRESGALATLIPALAGVSDTTLAAIDEIARPSAAPAGAGTGRPDRRMNRFIALFSELEPDVANGTVRALRFSNADTAWITGILARWRAIASDVRTKLLDIDEAAPPATAATRSAHATGENRCATPPAATVRRWVASMGRMRTRSVLRLAAARFAAERSEGAAAPSAAAMRALYRESLRVAFREPVEISDLAVDGDDLRTAGIPPGPVLGRILARLLEDVLEEPAHNSREWLIPRARELYSQLER